MPDGTEAYKDEHNAVFIHGLPTRVKHLESVVDTLHSDSLRTQGAITSLATQVSALAEGMKDFGAKLDAQRTRKPDWGTMATWAGVLLVVGAMAFAPVSDRIDHLEKLLSQTGETHVEEAYQLGQYSARLEALERMEERTWGHMPCTK